MKKLLLFILLCNGSILTMQHCLVPVSNSTSNAVTTIYNFPFYITQGGRYVLPLKQEIKVKDVYDHDQVMNLKGIRRYVHGMINVPSNRVTAIVIDLNGCTIDADSCNFPIVSMNNIYNDKLRIRVCNGIIKNNRSRATILAFLKNITVHNVTFENCKRPIVANSDMLRILNVTIINDDSNNEKKKCMPPVKKQNIDDILHQLRGEPFIYTETWMAL